MKLGIRESIDKIRTFSRIFVELQGTAEHNPFTATHLEDMLALARKGLKRIFALTRAGVAPASRPRR